MTFPTITAAELRTVESVLESDRGPGYVLNFSDRTFAAFFQEHGIDIRDPRYADMGTSKANRLRCFLRSTPPPGSGQVLAALLDYRQSGGGPDLHADTIARYRAAVQRLGGSLPASVPGQPHAPITEAALLGHVFKPEVFTRLPGNAALQAALVARMREAQRCVEHEAWLSAVILSGSVLEGMALGFGTAEPERVNRAYAAQYNKAVPRLWDWKLHEWITVLTRLGAFSPNVDKFGHALRDFRNYVHPAEQLAHGFSPDRHTARISFHVVQAAAEDLVRFCEGARP